MKSVRLTCLRCGFCSPALVRHEGLLNFESGQANSDTHQSAIITNLEAFGGRAQSAVKESVKNWRVAHQEAGLAAASGPQFATQMGATFARSG